MRTWKQGVIGKVTPQNQSSIFLRCLTYPLAQTFASLDSVSGNLAGPTGFVRVRLVDFALIERVGESRLTPADRRLDVEAAWSDWT